MRNDEVIERPVDHRTLTARYTDEAVALHWREPRRGRSSSISRTRCRTCRWRGRAEFVGHSAARHLRRRGRGDRLRASGGSSTPWRRPASTPHAGALHQRQRAVAAVRRRTAVRRTAARRQGHARGKAACARRRSSGGRARSSPASSPTSARRWICSPPRRRWLAPTLPADRPIDGVDLRAAADRHGPEPAPDALLLLGRRAARRPQGPLQGALHHQRRLRRSVNGGPTHAAAALRSRRRSRRAPGRGRGAPRRRRRSAAGGRAAPAGRHQGPAPVRRVRAAAAPSPGR